EDIFSQVHNSAQYGSIVIVSSNPDFFPGEGQGASDSLVNGLQRIFLESKVPVVAALDSNATGSAWLISLFCDACIYNEKGLYSYVDAGKTPVLSKEAAMIFSHRFGSYLGKEIMLTGAEYSGHELQQRVGTLKVADPGQVLSTALKLGKYWSGFPSDALFSWKKRMSLTIRKELKRLPSWIEDSTEELNPIYDTPAQIPLNSKVIKVTAHPEGILVVKMEDLEAKNMFSQAFLEGITEVFQHIEQTPLYKVVILTGYDSYFASGGTQEGLLAIQEGTVKYSDAPIYELPLHCKIPVISAMQGHGIGVGWAVGMFSDLILFSKESVYSSRFMNLGFTPGAGSTLIFPYQLGVDLSKEVLFTAQEYKGDELRRKGMLLPVVCRNEVY
ncbi:MAG: polyketide synthase of type I, partial [Planctomycetes bacterium]|nr:polyketide synthase of type I [Planctomycetota bacterium]